MTKTVSVKFFFLVAEQAFSSYPLPQIYYYFICVEFFGVLQELFRK